MSDPSEETPRPAGEAEQTSVSEPEDALPALALEDLPAAMRAACERAGWQKLMPAQSLVLPYLMDGRDIMLQSRTGSGKTGCYLLPMLESLAASAPVVQALVLVPTRELAAQVEREAATIFAGTGLAACALYGGVGYKKQLDALKGGAQVVVGTPGRVLDHILRRSLNLERLRLLVFDEADRMLSIGFYPDMVEIARYLPRKRQTALFSATYPPHVLKLAAEFMRRPDLLSLSAKKVHVAEVEHMFCQAGRMDKDRALVRLLELENPASAIIFCNTKANVHYLCEVLRGFGYNADELTADSSQQKREQAMERLRRGETRFLVATDLAARGIDIPDLSHVFLYEPPEDRESYIHRAGRTGRAGAAGTVISLVDIMERMELERIGRYFRINLRELAVPSDEMVADASSRRLLARLEAALRASTGLEAERRRRYLALAGELAASEDGLELLALALDAFGRGARLPALPAVAAAGTQKNGKSKKRRKRGGRGGSQESRVAQDLQAAPDAGPKESAAAPAPSAGNPASGEAAGDALPENSPDGQPADAAGAPRRRAPRRRGRGKAVADGGKQDDA